MRSTTTGPQTAAGWYPNRFNEARHWNPEPQDPGSSARLTRQQESALFRRTTQRAIDGWVQEAVDEHTFLLEDLRTRLGQVPDLQPSHREHIDTCVQVLGDALRCPTPHLDLSLLPPGHALRDEELQLFAQRRALMDPPLLSITLPARSTHLPGYLATFPNLTQVNAPDYAGNLDDLGMQPQWRRIQLGYFDPADCPRRAGVARGEPDASAPAQLELVLRPRGDDLSHQALATTAMRFVRLHPVGTPQRAEAVRLASALNHAVQWHQSTLDLSAFDPSLLQRADQHGLFQAFQTAHALPSAHAIQSARQGTTRYVPAERTPLTVTLPAGLPALAHWRA